MKILIISNLFPPYYLGGYELLCSQVCRVLQQRGYQGTVLTTDYGLFAPQQHPEEEVETATSHDFAVHRILKLYIPFGQPARLLRRRRWWVGKYNQRVTRTFIAQEKPDVIFIWSQLRLTLGAARAAQASALPVAYTFNDEHIAGFVPAPFALRPRPLARYVADNWVFPSITLRGLKLTHATCISQRLKSNLLARGVPINGAKVIYQGLPLEQFPTKAEIGKIARPARVLYMGQLHRYKGVHTLIAAAHLIAARYGPDLLKVSIMGDGPVAYKRELNNQARQGRAAITFFKKVAHREVARVYREHDIFVFPSTWQEPFGLTHLEAMASGTPVTSTIDGGHGEFIKDGYNALVFEKENAPQLAQQLLKLIRNGDLSRRLAANARAMVKQAFTLERYVTDLESFLHEAIARSIRSLKRR